MTISIDELAERMADAESAPNEAVWPYLTEVERDSWRAAARVALVVLAPAPVKTVFSKVEDVFARARETHVAAHAARSELAELMLEAMRKLLPSGQVIDLSPEGGAKALPAYLLRVNTVSGNDRGTKRFRIEEVLSVEPDARSPDLSRWNATAVPISEKTGKDMGAGTGRSAGRATVCLRGSMGCEHGLDEPVEKATERVIELVEQQLCEKGVRT